MAKLITDAAQIKDADTSDLVHTYNALTGKAVKRFENRAIAERRVEMAILAAKDADAKTGLPRGQEPTAQPREAIEAKAAARGVAPPPALDAEDAAPEFKPGTMAYELDKAAKNSRPIAPRPRAKDTPKEPKKDLHAVVSTFKGNSKPQEGSVRNSVLAYIQAAPKSAATLATLEKHFGLNPRGYVQKLVEKNHLRIIDAAEFAALPAQHPDKPASEQK